MEGENEQEIDQVVEEMSPVDEEMGVNASMPEVLSPSSNPNSYFDLNQSERRAQLIPTPSPPKRMHLTCDSCQQQDSGELIVCSTCHKSFHFTCVEPPITEKTRKTKWNCNICQVKDSPQPSLASGMFCQLIDNVSRMNPQPFSLPNSLKSYIEGVSWDPDTGDYIDSTKTKPLQTFRISTELDQSLFALKNPDGTPIICHYCGLSALKGAIVSCEYCPMKWHMDCLTPPMTCPPPVNKKWMCPLHVDDLVPNKRKFTGRETVRLISTDIKNDGDVDILLDPGFPEQKGIQKRSRVRYLIPERSIKLAFIEKIGGLRQLWEHNQMEMNSKTTKQDENSKVNGIENMETDENMKDEFKPNYEYIDNNCSLVQAPPEVLKYYGKPDRRMKKTQVVPTYDNASAVQVPNEMKDIYEESYNEKTLKKSVVSTPEEAKTWLLGLSQFYENVKQEIQSLSSSDSNETSLKQNPFDKIDDVNILTNIAFGKLDPCTVLSVETKQDYSNLEEDPMYLQFMAWKRMIAKSNSDGITVESGYLEHNIMKPETNEKDSVISVDEAIMRSC